MLHTRARRRAPGDRSVARRVREPNRSTGERRVLDRPLDLGARTSSTLHAALRAAVRRVSGHRVARAPAHTNLAIARVKPNRSAMRVLVLPLTRAQGRQCSRLEVGRPDPLPLLHVCR